MRRTSTSRGAALPWGARAMAISMPATMIGDQGQRPGEQPCGRSKHHQALAECDESRLAGSCSSAVETENDSTPCTLTARRSA